MIRTRFLLPTLTALAALTGCGADDVEEITYIATLQPMNGSDVNGTATFVESGEDDLFSVSVVAEGLAAGLHPQHVHAAAACPSTAADANDDGFVDVMEGVPSYGAILIPLDGDLSDQAAGMPEGFPTAGEGGIIDYQATTALGAMLDDLLAADPEAPLTGLEGELALASRTVVLHGIAETSSTTLPGSVGSIGDTPAFLTLPVACGTIELSDVDN